MINNFISKDPLTEFDKFLQKTCTIAGNTQAIGGLKNSLVSFMVGNLKSLGKYLDKQLIYA